MSKTPGPVIGLACILSLAILSGCPQTTFKLHMRNTGATNTITGIYMVAQGSKDPDWGPNLLNVNTETGVPIPIGPGSGVWLDHEFVAGPTYDWMVEFASAVGDLRLPSDSSLSESDGQLVFKPGISTSRSVSEIAAFAALEPSSSGGLPTGGMGYNWGPPE